MKRYYNLSIYNRENIRVFIFGPRRYRIQITYYFIHFHYSNVSPQRNSPLSPCSGPHSLYWDVSVSLYF